MRKLTPNDFWARVKKSDGCWLWTGHRVMSPGYAEYGNLRYQGKTIRAHRLAWVLANGPIGDGLSVCHSCDTPLCCRPEHLFLGTAKDNADDRGRKMRQARGERMNTAKLTPEAVMRARQMRRSGQSNRDIAYSLGVHPDTARRAISGMTWRHL